MTNESANKNRSKGSALIAAVLAAAVLLIFLQILMTMGISQRLTADRFNRRLKAFYIAEAGLGRTISWLRLQAVPPVGNTSNPWGGVVSLNNGTYSVAIQDLGIVGGNGSAVRRYRAVSNGTFGGVSRRIAKYFQVDNFARYIWFTNIEMFSGNNVWFWTPDRLNGPTHTNGRFNIYGNPTFVAEAESVDNVIQFYNNSRPVNLTALNTTFDHPDFQGGMTFGAPVSTMPTQIGTLRAAAGNPGGLLLNGTSTVTLLNNGTMNVTNSARGWTNYNTPVPANSALFVANGTLTISGTLNGTLTAGSNRDIIIPNNITYADDPRINATSNDVLGIISESDVVIDDAGPDNLEIDGCIMAMSTSFLLENWDTVSPKGTLTVYGGIIQRQRGPVGTFNGATGVKRSGYDKNYSYDSRMLNSPPAYMPNTGGYVALAWEED